MMFEASPASPEQEGQAVAAESAPVSSQTDVEAGSSPEGVKSMLDIARAALGDTEDLSASPAEVEEVQEAAEEPEQPTIEFTDEELGLSSEEPAPPPEEEKLPFGKHPRFRELLKERNTYRDQVRAYETDAGQYREIRKYLDQMQLSEQDAADALVLAAQLKHAREGKYDAKQVLERIDQMRADLAVRAGTALPADIQQRLDEGLIDEDSAKELAQARLAKQEVETVRAQLDVRETSDETRQRVQEFRDVATRWEAAIKVRDPDYEVKREAIADYVRLLRQERGAPENADQVLVLLRDAYKTVNQRFGKLIPRPAAKQPGLSSDRSQVPTTSEPKPKTLLDAARLGLVRAHQM